MSEISYMCNEIDRLRKLLDSALEAEGRAWEKLTEIEDSLKHAPLIKPEHPDAFKLHNTANQAD